MGDATHPLPLPTDALSDWRSRWNALYDFIEAWRGEPFRPAVAERQINEIEVALGVPLSPSVREWVSFVAAREQIEDCFTWRDVFVVKQLEQLDAISILLQGEGDVYWAIESAHWAEPDPPVTVHVLDYDFHDPSNPERQEFIASEHYAHLSQFAFHYLLSYFHTRCDKFGFHPSLTGVTRRHLESDFGPSIAFGRIEMFQRAPLFLWCERGESSEPLGHLTVMFRAPVSEDVVPASLRALLGGGGSRFNGAPAITTAERKSWWHLSRWFSR